MLRKLLVIVCGICLVSCADVSTNDSDTTESGLVVSTNELNTGINARIPFLLSYQPDSTKFPRSVEESGEVRGVPSKDWCSGFFPGSLMYLYQITGDQALLDRAEQWNPWMEKEQWNGKTHDMGFKVYCSIGKAYELTNNPHYKDVILQSAVTLSTRFNPTVGCIKSWDFGKDRWQYPVIIDNMMNLELLFEATKLSGDSSFYKIADAHASNTLVNHYRPDNSCFHVIDYDESTGAVAQQLTHQGFDVASVWSRGQAWGFYGFTMCYRYTQDQKYLDQAMKIADFIMDHPVLPEDKIPYWDMKDPQIPNAPKDASAAAVMASAALELYQYSNNEKHLNFAQTILETLSSNEYVLSDTLDVPFILDHSTGNWPAQDEIDAPISYADYYFVEAIFREKELLVK